ncbi:MAG: alpha-ribazole transporter [Bacillota bacterium]
MRDASSASRTRRIAVMSMSIALAAAGSLIKIPSPVGTVALDSWPGYACALVLGPVGAWVALAGHLASGSVAGFPLGLAIHGVIAAEMVFCALAFRWVTGRFGAVPGVVAAVVLNGLVAPFALLPWLEFPLVLTLLLPLTVAAAVNVSLAAVVARAVKRGFVVPGRP